MSRCCSWLTRPCWSRRETQHAYIYLYSPDMRNSSSSSSATNCLVCILFGLCLAFIVILAAVLIYHLNSTEFIPLSTTTVDPRIHIIAKKRQLPDFVNINIDPCEHFYDFVCDKWTRTNQRAIHDDYQLKSTQIQREIHSKLMSNLSESSISSESKSTDRFYQMCEHRSPILLLDELEHYFGNLSQQEPYRSYLTLFNRTLPTGSCDVPLVGLMNSLFRIQPRSFDTSAVVRRVGRHPRPYPSALSIFPNVTILNQTALKDLIQFDEALNELLQNEATLIEPYRKSSNIDTLRVQRIYSYSNYSQCLPSSSSLSKKSNGLQKFIGLLNDFLRLRLGQLRTNSIDKQMKTLEKLRDNRTLIEHLQRIENDLKTIDQVIFAGNETDQSNASCLIDLFDHFLDERIRFDELPSILKLSFDRTTEYFVSDHWPFLHLLHDQLLKNLSRDIWINFAFFDTYRQLIYPYYQPHIHRTNEINLLHHRQYSGLTSERNYPELSCLVNSCWDIFHCYHRSLVNPLMIISNQTFLHNIEKSVHFLLNRFRLLIEQSDHLHSRDKKILLDEFQKIEIHIGHFPSPSSISSQFDLPESSSYLEYVQYLSSLPYDDVEPSYFVEPIYFPSNHSLYLPFGFLSLSNETLDSHLIKLFFKILRRISSIENPFHIECLLHSVDSDPSTTSEWLTNSDEQLTYIFLRSKYIDVEKILLDEYLWPFMSANGLMKRFLIDYTAENYCRSTHGDQSWKNNSYLIDDIYLIFHCPQASSIKQSKCTII